MPLIHDGIFPSLRVAMEKIEVTGNGKALDTVSLEITEVSYAFFFAFVSGNTNTTLVKYYYRGRGNKEQYFKIFVY